MNDSSLPTVQVSLSVVFNILNAYNRRNENSPRIVGTLLGEIKDNIVNVSHYCLGFHLKDLSSFIIVHSFFYLFVRKMLLIGDGLLCCAIC